MNKAESDSTTKATKNNEKEKKEKKKMQLPSWVLYPVWFLCVCVVLGCAFFVVWYGIAFGNQKSLKWLGSVTIVLVEDILLIQPIKVLLIAISVAMFVKKLENQERRDIDEEVAKLTKDDNWRNDVTLDHKKGLFDRANTESLLPPNADKLSKLRKLRYKEKQLKAISKEIMLYLVFTVVAGLLGFSLRDYQAYYQTRDIEETLNLKYHDIKNKLKYTYLNADTKEKVWEYLENVFVPKVFPSKWFELDKKYENESFYDFPGFMFLNDMTSKIVTGARLRQLRVKPNSCTKVKDIEKQIKIDCAGHYQFLEEETQSYDHDWFRSKEYDQKINPVDMPWRFQESSALDGYLFKAEIETYSGAGYVVELFPKWDNHAILKNLKQRKWLDRHTRALFIEFAVFNGGTNYFDSITVVFEFPPWGGVVHYSTVTTFKLYVSTSSYAMFVFIAQILFLLFTVLFIMREARVLYKQGCTYFTEFWNLIEFSNIILSLNVIGFFFWRSVLAKRLSSQLPEKSPENYINLQFTAMVDQFMTYVFALICFCVTVKFIKLLRFNKRISMLSTTLKKAWFPLMMFGILYSIILIACTCFTTLAFGHNLYGYKDSFSSFTSVMSLLLGKFSYYQFENTNRALGPVFFFGFNIFVNWIVMNMYISILNDVLSEVYADLRNQSDEYEMVEYMISNFKVLFGMSGDGMKLEALEDALEEEPMKEEELNESRSALSKDTSDNNEQNDYVIAFSHQKTNSEELHASKENFDNHLSLLSLESNFGAIQEPNADDLKERLKPFTRKVNSALDHLSEASALNGVDEGYFDTLLILSLIVTTRCTKAANKDTESNSAPVTDVDASSQVADGLAETDRCLSVIHE